MHRANNGRRVVIADGLPESADDFRETGVGYEHPRPDALEQLLFRQRARPVFDQQRQQLERFRGETHWTPVAGEAPRARVEGATGKTKGHADTGRGDGPILTTTRIQENGKKRSGLAGASPG